MKRRDFLGSTGAISLSLAMTDFFNLKTSEARTLPDVVIYVSRLASHVSFVSKAVNSNPHAISFDIADQEDTLWTSARYQLKPPRGSAIMGLTRWSDWNGLRGVLSEQKFRTRREVHVGDAEFLWIMT